MYLLIPIELCSYVISKPFYSPFQLYIYLKSICSGKIKLSEEDLNEAANNLQFKSVKTVKNNLEILLKDNWIGYSSKSGYYFIRGFNSVMKMEGFFRRAAAEFDAAQINSLNEFLTAAFIGKLNRNKIWKLREVERQKGRSRQASRIFPEFFSIANRYLAKILKISPNKAFRLKEKAANAGLLVKRRTFVKMAVKAENLKSYLKAFPENTNKAKIFQGEIYLQDSDQVKSLVVLRRRKKIEPYKKGYRETKA